MAPRPELLAKRRDRLPVLWLGSLFVVLLAICGHADTVSGADLAASVLLGASLIGVDSPRWSSILRTAPHDFYHLPGYVALSARHEGGQPAAVVVEGDGAAMLLPLILRPIPGGGKDATSPYGYPGPIFAGPRDDRFATDAISEAAKVLAEQGVVSLFVRFHPLLNPEPRSEFGTIVSHGETVVIDLSQDDAEMWRETRRNHRREIRNAQLAGHRVYEDVDLRHFARFTDLYQQSMLRVDAAPFYFFDDAYFDALRSTLGSRLHLIVVELDGVIATASIEVETDGIVQDYLTGTDERLNRHAPGKLLIHFVRSWARQRGNRWLHLGGGLGAVNDSLLAFKAGFSRRRLPFHTLRAVLDEDRYRELVRTFNPVCDPDAVDGFFPAYRLGTQHSGTNDAGASTHHRTSG
jgi:hypothetical protein